MFIAIALLHIMPEQMEEWESMLRKQYLEENPGADLSDMPCAQPLPFILLVVGYTLIFVFDKVVFEHETLAKGNLDEISLSIDFDKKSLSMASSDLRKKMEQMAQNSTIDKNSIDDLLATQRKLDSEIQRCLGIDCDVP